MTETHHSSGAAAPAPATASRPRVAVVTMGVKLGHETRGYTRFRVISEMLAEAGFEVDLITSSFQHWDKAPRDTAHPSYTGLPYRISFIHEPGYRRNLDLARIRSHRVAARNLRAHFDRIFAEGPGYRLIYAEIPPNDVARVCAQEAQRHGIPFVADVNDLWPEAMRMVLNVPILSDMAFYPFARDAKIAYRLLSAAVGTSEEYAARPAADRTRPYERLCVYVGNRLDEFDAGAQRRAADVRKPAGELWAAYAGTLGASYDLATLVRAAQQAEQRRMPGEPRLRVKVLGDGPDRAALEALAQQLKAPVDFVGYAPYDLMAAYLSASDIVVNSLVRSAPQSIVTKIGDYLASGSALVNTGSSPEMRALVSEGDVGLNVEAENEQALCDALETLMRDPDGRARMAENGRRLAELRFDQRTSYLPIVDMVRRLACD
ncbi:glycosyltransferase family 4 protein [Berryella wangjianweii]|nr:glycosyltransferase family 4 protein [Berryella wangjianweii]